MTKPEERAFLTPLLVSLVFAALSLPACLFAQAPTFGQPTVSGIQGVGFEQDIRLDPAKANRVYTSVPGSLSSDTSWIWHSEDGGKTLNEIGPGAPQCPVSGLVNNELEMYRSPTSIGGGLQPNRQE